MANKDKDKSPINNKRVNGLMSLVQGTLDKLRTDTYFSPLSNSKDIQDIRDNINNSLDDILQSNYDSTGLANISQLYTRMADSMSKEDKGIGNELDNIFNDKTITDGLLPTFIENKQLLEYEEEIDTLCRYMPSLDDALDAKKDHVLTADHFAKDFINVVNNNVNADQAKISNDVDEIKKRYGLVDFFEEIYDTASKYGEQFVYITDYKTALSRLLRDKASTRYVKESVSLLEYANEVDNSMNLGAENFNDIKVNFYKNAIVQSVVESTQKIYAIQEATAGFERIIDDELEFEGLNDSEKSAKDGFVDLNKTVSKNDIKINGCILKKLKRENVLPIYIDDTCLGYYYVECNFTDLYSNSVGLKNTIGYVAGKGKDVFDVLKKANKEDALNFLSNKISNLIDAKFINANQDLRKEIYIILQHNDIFNKNNVEININFIPPQDMVHVMFNEDPKTHRGISDLDKAMIPAKLYTALYVTNTIGVLTRGYDKRVYYVKQQVDTNISQLLLTTINQIKKSNFGTRELSSLKNTLNVTGRYNDLIIPVSASGDSPVQFEIMQGQDIDTKPELMEALEEMAVNSTDVPYEYVQSRKQVDFATRLTMANVKFLRTVYKRQAKTQRIFSRILNRIWISEFPESTIELEVQLPPPAYLEQMNVSQLVQSVIEYTQMITESEIVDVEDIDDEESIDKIKALFNRELNRHILANHIDIATIDKIKEKIQLDFKVKQGKKEEE